ncbi:SDR family oxidoreductase [uncultured Eudoraea sp.]|jgi:NAD(P)-dependent dehydrogenase (short-subunit alcohol dehydrogenase family)|uniref:SDR family oxidoreductase n=1 Tax=uncultured Eudoraea sp. TaxID=1035614 RepID=UPI0026084969|nr:SDR family oxidoreductase [uncultured Eudoraea sp.]
MNQKSKIAIVTGAGSGIGRAVAIALNKDGWTVVLAGRQEKNLLETAASCNKSDTMVVPTDVKNPESVKNLFAQILKTYGRLDLLFNNAGVSAPVKPMEELTIEEWKHVIDTNLNGVFFCTQEAFRIMKSQDPMGGRIINNGSLSAHVPRPYSAPYTASKHAVTGLTRSTSLDGRVYNIACGQIDIGNSKSEMTKKMEKGTLQADGSYKIEPTINPEDVGRTVVYMAGLPLNTNVPFITIMANKMPYIGRG